MIHEIIHLFHIFLGYFACHILRWFCLFLLCIFKNNLCFLYFHTSIINVNPLFTVVRDLNGKCNLWAHTLNTLSFTGGTVLWICVTLGQSGLDRGRICLEGWSWGSQADSISCSFCGSYFQLRRGEEELQKWTSLLCLILLTKAYLFCRKSLLNRHKFSAIRKRSNAEF